LRKWIDHMATSATTAATGVASPIRNASDAMRYSVTTARLEASVGGSTL
jgi:hypothetical protein